MHFVETLNINKLWIAPYFEDILIEIWIILLLDEVSLRIIEIAMPDHLLRISLALKPWYMRLISMST